MKIAVLLTTLAFLFSGEGFAAVKWRCETKVKDRSGTHDWDRCKGTERIACYEEVTETCRATAGESRTRSFTHYTGTCTGSYSTCWRANGHATFEGTVEIELEGGVVPTPRNEVWDCKTNVKDRSGTYDYDRCRTGPGRIACYEDQEEICVEKFSRKSRTVRRRHFTGKCGTSYRDCW